jgi:hypothetical protein
VAVLFLSASTLLADGTLLGTIAGRVVDQEGNALPGANVEVVSTDKGFQRSLASDTAGAFNFPLLQPGAYTLRVSRDGFQTFEARGSLVAPDKTTTVIAELRVAAATEALTVTGEPPLVDKTNMSATTSVTSTLSQKLAVGRDFQSLISFAPGISNESGGNPNSHGALASNNQYLFDGVDTTDPTTGAFWLNINYEAIEQVDVSTTGISAEYGRAQGAYVNVITKSGTNQLRGSFKILLTNDEWNAQNKGSSPIDGTPFARTKYDRIVTDYAGTLGGPIWRDRFWFFGAYESVRKTSPQFQTTTSALFPEQTGQNYQQTTDVRLWDGKLSGQITPSQLLVAQFNSDPITGFVVDYWGGAADLGALTSQDQNTCGGIGCLKQLRWSGVFGARLSAEAGYAQAAGNITVAPFQGDGTPFFSNADQLYYNGATFDGFVSGPRTQANVSGSLFHELFGNSAQFKAGVDYQNLRSEASFTYPTDQLYVVAEYDPVLGPGSQVFQVGDEWDVFIDPQPSTSRGKIWGFYGLEKVEIGRLNLNLGVRIDYQTSESDLARTVVKATTASPRLSAAWDVTGDGKLLVSAGFGTYHQFIVQNLADTVFAGAPQQTDKDVYLWDGSHFVFDHPVRFGGNAQPANRSLKPSRSDQFNVAIQRQIGSTMAVGLRGIYCKWYGLIDDVKNLVGDQVILTPRNFPDSLAHRSYKAIELTFEKRFAGNWQALANYTLGRTYGNEFADFASQLFDFPGSDCTVAGVGTVDCSEAAGHNQYGIANYDRTSVLNAYVAYTWNLRIVDITAAPSGTLASGLPYQQQVVFAFPDGSPGNYFYTKRGSSRLPTFYALNFALEASFRPFNQRSFWLVGGPIELGVKGEVCNLTNQQKIVDTAFISTLPDEYFGEPTSRNAMQPPRSFRFTGLVRF